jgi:hypothetical protein
MKNKNKIIISRLNIKHELKIFKFVILHEHYIIYLKKNNEYIRQMIFNMSNNEYAFSRRIFIRIKDQSTPIAIIISNIIKFKVF